MNITRQICRRIYRDNVNVLTCPTHEAYETGLSKTGYNFYGALHPQVKNWNASYRPLPKNYYLVNFIPPIQDFDIVLSQNKFGQYQILAPLAQQFQLPMISLEHTLPPSDWGDSIMNQVKNMRGNLNVFISEYSVEKWGFSFNDNSVRVIKHGIDTDIFKPSDTVRQNKILTVANDFINRDWCLNYTQFCEVTKGKNPTVIGHTPGLSEAAKSLDDLVNAYQSHRIYLNTAHVSPIPTSLLEAMACGCAVVSCNTAAIPDYVEHGVNGFLAKNTEEMNSYINELSNDEALANELGKNAALTIKEKFNLTQFCENWKKVIGELV